MTNARREIRVIEEAEQDEVASDPTPQAQPQDVSPEKLSAELAATRVDVIADQQPVVSDESNIAMPFTTDGFRDIDTESYLAGSSLGVALRQARLKRKLNLDEVASILHIRKEYLQAIEQGNYRSLPGRTYAIGFVRTYAQHLGLDPLDAIQRFKDETEGGGEASLAFPKADSEKRVPGAAIVVGSIVAAGVLYGAWYLYSGDESVTATETAATETAAAKPASPAKAAAEPKAAVSAETTATQPAAAASKSDRPAANTATSPDAASAAVAAQVEAASDAAAPAQQPAPAAESTAVENAEPASDAAAEDAAPVAEEAAAVATGRVEVSVKSGSWIQIRNAEGAVVFTKLLRPGETYQVPADKTGFTLLTGDAGALQIRVDGKLLPSLGSPGEVRRDIPLDAEKLLADAGAGD